MTRHSIDLMESIGFGISSSRRIFDLWSIRLDLFHTQSIHSIRECWYFLLFSSLFILLYSRIRNEKQIGSIGYIHIFFSVRRLQLLEFSNYFQLFFFSVDRRRRQFQLNHLYIETKFKLAEITEINSYLISCTITMCLSSSSSLSPKCKWYRLRYMWINVGLLIFVCWSTIYSEWKKSIVNKRNASKWQIENRDRKKKQSKKSDDARIQRTHNDMSSSAQNSHGFKWDKRPANHSGDIAVGKYVLHFSLFLPLSVALALIKIKCWF